MQTRFRLTRHFTLTSLVAFVLVGGALLHLAQRQTRLIAHMQEREAQQVQAIQTDFLARARDLAQHDLVAIQEQSNVSLTRLFANVLWRSDVARFLDAVRPLNVSRCHGVPVAADQRDCVQRLARQLMALPRFAALDRRVREVVRNTSVFQLKLYDHTGVIVYATDLKQIGQDRSSSAGWQGAALRGDALSELSFRDRFNTLHGEVVNRDLVSSYVAVADASGQQVVGVLEVYADVTPFLTRIRANSEHFLQVATDNEVRLGERARSNADEMAQGSRQQLAITGVALLLLYGALLVIVRHAQSLIEARSRETESARQRLAQAEKMTALGQMVAGVAHQLNTPLAFARTNALMAHQSLDDLAACVGPLLRDPVAGLDPAFGRAVAEVNEARAMLDDVILGVSQMNELVINLRNFSRLDRAPTAEVNLNTTLSSVCYIARTVVSTKIELIQAFQPLPPITCNVSQMNQVFLNLIMNAAQAIDGPGTIMVSTRRESRHVVVSVHDSGQGMGPDLLARIFEPYFTTKPAGEGTGLGLSIAHDIVEQHGGTIEAQSHPGQGSEFRVRLPISKETHA